jgi:alpha-ribazole phosphatase/probable phosphoglycerate mutase
VTTVYLARHGESDWNAANRFQGHSNRPLTKEGRRQAEALAELVAHKNVDAIYSSPLIRALETAQIVAARTGLEVTELDDLREVDTGSWSGLSRAEVQERFPEGFERWIAGGSGWEDGETYEEMGERALRAVRTIAAAHLNKRVLVVSHGGPIRAIQAAANGMDIHEYRRVKPVEPNARLSVVTVDDGRFASASIDEPGPDGVSGPGS